MQGRLELHSEYLMTATIHVHMRLLITLCNFMLNMRCAPPCMKTFMYTSIHETEKSVKCILSHDQILLIVEHV